MISVLLVIILLASVISGHLQKTASFISACGMAWTAGIMPTNYSFDTAVYEKYYPFSPQTKIFEQGYMHISYFMYNHGIDYTTFRIILYAIAYLILFVLVIKVTPKPALFFLLYGFVSFLSDATQVRNFCMLVLVMLAFIILNKVTPLRLIISGISLILAVSFQTTGLIYVVAILVYVFKLGQKPGSKLVSIYFGSMLVLAVFFIVFGNTQILSPILNRFIQMSGRSYVDQAVMTYSTGGYSRYTLLYAASYAIAFMVIHYLKKRVGQGNNWYYDAMYILFLVGVIGMPLTIVSSGFERILRNSLVIFIILITRIPSYYWKKDAENFVIIGSLATFALCMYGAGYFTNDPLYMGYYFKYMLHFVATQ